MKEEIKRRNITEKDENLPEWLDNDLCPCNSGKKYKDCCKTKNFKYYKKSEKEYIKSIPISDEVQEVLKIALEEFKNIWGREPSNEDYIMAGMIDNKMNSLTRKLKYDPEIPREYIYAYDRTGILLNENNIDKLPDVEIKQFQDAMQEYNNLMEQKVGETANILQIAEATNEILKDLWERTSYDMIYVLNRYIKELKQNSGIESGFTVKNKKDFLVYCAYKTVHHLETLDILIQEGFTENSYAVVRFIYEILLNVIVFTNDDELFKNKILPLAGLDNGTFEIKDKTKKNILTEKTTGKEYYCAIKKSELAKRAGKDYELLYSIITYIRNANNRRVKQV